MRLQLQLLQSKHEKLGQRTDTDAALFQAVPSNPDNKPLLSSLAAHLLSAPEVSLAFALPLLCLTHSHRVR